MEAIATTIHPHRDGPLIVSSEVTLVSLETARAMLGLDSESVVALVDCGRLRWVWDFATPGSDWRREMRFWTTEVLRVAGDMDASAVPEDHVVSCVIGPTPNGRQRAAAIAVRWCLSLQSIMRLVRAQCLSEDRVYKTRYLRRTGLEEFLESRLIR